MRLHNIGKLSIHAQFDINDAAPSQITRQSQVRLIQPDQTALRACKAEQCVHAANIGAHIRQAAVITKACTEQDQIHLFLFGTHINRRGDIAILCGVPFGHRLYALRTVSFKPENHCGGNACT